MNNFLTEKADRLSVFGQPHRCCVEPPPSVVEMICWVCLNNGTDAAGDIGSAVSAPPKLAAKSVQGCTLFAMRHSRCPVYFKKMGGGGGIIPLFFILSSSPIKSQEESVSFRLTFYVCSQRSENMQMIYKFAIKQTWVNKSLSHLYGFYFTLLNSFSGHQEYFSSAGLLKTA